MTTTLDNKKEQERARLHSTIWKIANDLRGSVDGWDFKQYVLGILFYRFISENLSNYINAEERRTGADDFSYSDLSDDAAEFGRADTVKEKGFYILPSELFENVRKRAKNEENLNEILSGIFRNIENSAKGADSEDDIKGLFDDLDVNSSKLGQTVAKRNERLVKLLDAIGSLEVGRYEDNTIDAFGDAYEFLMTMYASSAGKSGGEFFTPQEVSELLARITVVGKTEVNKVYDPACGSGSLLLKFAKVLGKENVRQGFFGQEINLTTYNLCRINMYLHDINYEKFDIAHGDTLTDPAHWDDEPFDAIVSNPPYSIKWAGDSDPLMINDPRFSPAGVIAPKSYADLAFTMHILSWLSTSGTAAIVEYPGVLYRGYSEAKIRKYLIDNNFVDAVIQLPPDLFFGTTIATCIIILKKSKNVNSTLFIDASAEFVHVGNKNKLSQSNQDKILEAFTNRENIKHFCKLVPNSDIAENNYNLSVDNYIDDVDAAIATDITELNSNILTSVKKQKELRKQIEAKISELTKERCPNGVPHLQLGEVAQIINGYSFKSGKYSSSGIRVVRISDVQKGKMSDKNLKYYPLESETEIKRYLLRENDLVMSLTGNVGRVAMLSRSDLPAGLNQRVACIRPKEIVMTRWLFHFLNTDAFENEAMKNSTGGGQKNMSTAWLSKQRIPVPPLQVQEEIVKVLDEYTQLNIALTDELTAEHDAIRKQYSYYRTKLITFQNLKDE